MVNGAWSQCGVDGPPADGLFNMDTSSSEDNIQSRKISPKMHCTI